MVDGARCERRWRGVSWLLFGKADRLAHMVAGSDAAVRLSSKVLALVLVLGAVLRVRQYLAGRSLWIDEALLALNLVRMSPADIIGGLAYHQTAPVGFLALEVASVGVFGTSENALRLVPLISGLLSLLFFPRVASSLLGRVGLFTAVTLFAFSDSLVYYSSEVKQYALDVLVTLAIYAAVFSTRCKSLTPQLTLILAGTGLIGVWFSHPAVFILAACGAGLLLEAWVERDRARLRQLAAVCVIWALSFLAAYAVTERAIPEPTRRYLARVWSVAFAPAWPFSLTTYQWWLDNTVEMFRMPLGLPLPGIGILLCCLALFAGAHRRRRAAWYLATPTLLALAASAAGAYPFSGRLLLFLVPGLFIVIGRGADLLWKQSGAVARSVAVLAIVLLLGGTVASVPDQLQQPTQVEEIAPVMRYLQQNYRPNDLVYLFYPSQYAFAYYASERGLAVGNPEFAVDSADSAARASDELFFRPALASRPPNFVVGTYLPRKWEAIEAELKSMLGRERVWVVFAHSQTVSGISEQTFYLLQLDKLGTRLDDYRQPRASVYLYDLSTQAQPPIEDRNAAGTDG
jgi:hypothetical protein